MLDLLAIAKQEYPMYRLLAFPLLVLSGAYCAQSALAQSPTSDDATVLKAEEAFRQGKLRNDTNALDKILADEYVGVNQYGLLRNKTEFIERFRSFKVSSLTPPASEVRLAGDAAIVTGSQTEVNPRGSEKLSFVRIYVKRAGSWRLLSSTQFFPLNSR